MGRWSTEEEKLIQVVRGRCAKELAEVIPFPEVVGDRRIIRFIRAKSGNANGLEQSIQLYRDFLIWRKENNVDLIRNRIVYEGYNNPLAFPHGQIILDLQPTIVIAPEATDKRGQPIVLEIFGRNPASLLDKVSISDYVQFLVYCLEFRAIVLEQISDSHEKEYLAKCTDERSSPDGYGVVLKICIIRDLNGVSLSHLQQKARDVIKAGLNVAIPNYPEYLGKSHLINVPFFFNIIWMMIKSFLDVSTLEKISLNGTDFIKLLKDEISYDSIPHEVGGGFFGINQSFDFDISEGGPLWYLGAPAVKISYDYTLGLDSSKRRSRSSSLGNLDLAGKREPGSSGTSPLVTPLSTIRKRLSNNVSDKIRKRLSSDNLAGAPVTLLEHATRSSEKSESKKDVSTTFVSDTKWSKLAPVKNLIKSLFFAAVTNPIISCVYALVLITTFRSLSLTLLVMLPIAVYYILQLCQYYITISLA